MKFIDLTGETFGRLKAICRDRSRLGTVWVCTCACGMRSSVTGTALRSGRIKSCGCLAREATSARNSTHRMSHTTEYYIWNNMRRRCLEKTNARYADYGGRGITVCSAWLSFQGFFDAMGYRPDGLTLERRDNDGGYCPENCYWATKKEQSNNRGGFNVRVNCAGETLTVGQWADRTGIDKETIYARLKRGWTPQRSVSEPVHA